MHEQQPKRSIVDRDSIPPLPAPEAAERRETGALRHFRAQEQLEGFLPPPSTLAVSSVALQPHERFEVRAQGGKAMLIFYGGSGQLLGQPGRDIAAGDVVVVPGGREQAIVGGPDGLLGLSVQLGEDLYASQPAGEPPCDDPLSLQQLLERAEQRARQFRQAPFFAISRDGTLDDPATRRRFLAALKVWLDGSRTLLFARQASCRDPHYAPLFFRHLQQELDRRGSSAGRGGALEAEVAQIPIARDPALEAITGWFSYQMLVLDNVEKAALVHLVIERAGVTYGVPTQPGVDGAEDAEQAAFCRALLRGQDARTYERLATIVDEAWDMLEAMTERVVELTVQTHGAAAT